MSCLSSSFKRFWRRYFGRLPDPEPMAHKPIPWDARAAFHNLYNEQQKLNATVQSISSRQDAFKALIRNIRTYHEKQRGPHASRS